MEAVSRFMGGGGQGAEMGIPLMGVKQGECGKRGFVMPPATSGESLHIYPAPLPLVGGEGGEGAMYRLGTAGGQGPSSPA